LISYNPDNDGTSGDPFRKELIMTLNSEYKKFFILLGIMYIILGPIVISILIGAPSDIKSIAAIPGLLLTIGTIIGVFTFKNRNNEKEKWYYEQALIDAKHFTRIEYDNRVLFVDGNWAWSFPKDCKDKIYTKFEVTKYYNRKQKYISYLLSPYSKHEFTIRKG